MLTKLFDCLIVWLLLLLLLSSLLLLSLHCRVPFLKQGVWLLHSGSWTVLGVFIGRPLSCKKRSSNRTLRTKEWGGHEAATKSRRITTVGTMATTKNNIEAIVLMLCRSFCKPWFYLHTNINQQTHEEGCIVVWSSLMTWGNMEGLLNVSIK